MRDLIKHIQEDDIFKPASKKEVAKRQEGGFAMPPIEAQELEWAPALRDIILGYKDGSTDPLDGDEVDRLVEILRKKINYLEGNITYEEYLA